MKSTPVGADLCVCPCNEGGKGKEGEHIGSPLQKDLPEGWEWKTLGEACTVILGQSPESTTYNTERNGLPFFQGKAEFGARYPTVVKWCSHPKKVARKDDILMSVRAPVGPTNFAPSECCIGRGLAAIRPTERIDLLYVFYYLRKIERELSEMGTGTTFKAISGDVLKSIEVPIAPLNQQRKIVSEIEKQFSRLDEAVAALKRIKANLKRYKAAVLKAAVEGKLTEEWRRNNVGADLRVCPDSNKGQTHRFAPTKHDNGTDLLKRILAVRKKKWEAEHPGKKYKEPSPPDTSTLPELPKGWVWVTLGELIDEPKYGTSKKCHYKIDGLGVLRIPNIANGIVDISDLKFAEFDENEIQTYRLREGDILTIRSNGSVSLVGRCALITKQDEKYLYAGYLIRMRPIRGTVHSKYLMICLSSLLLRKQIEAKAKSTSGVNNINSGELQSLIVPICGKNEQNEIARIVDEKLSGVEYLLSTVDLNLNRAERLRQAILREAFSGGLVSRDDICHV